MSRSTRINSVLTSRRDACRRQNARPTRRHSLPLCQATGLARYRDRHQALDGAGASVAGECRLKVSTFACPDCRGFHLERAYAREPITVAPTAAPSEAFTSTLAFRRRRYVLVDIENPTRGARATAQEVAAFWALLKQQAPGIAPHDHVVVGAARAVVRKYRDAIRGANVKWVVEADAPDGADRALLAAIDLSRVAQEFDELVIVSGDHAFADLARRAKSHGLAVHVVTTERPGQRSTLSRELAAVADTRTRVRLRSRSLTRDNVAAIHGVARAGHHPALQAAAA